MHFAKTLTTLVLAFPMIARAQEPAAPAPQPTPASEPALSAAVEAPAPVTVSAAPAAPAAPAVATPTVIWEALVDSYYLYNFTGDPSTQGPSFRQFDTQANSFTLSYAKLGLQADLDSVAARVDVGYGLIGPGFFVQQAFATAKFGSAVSLDAGRFVTHAGAEVIETNKNWLYSRSLLFFGIPLYHTGVRLNFTISPALKAMVSVVNGWNNDPDDNEGKTFGANLTYAADGITASGTTYVGKEGAGASDYRLLLDGVFLIDVSSRVSLGANIDFLKEGDNHWFGAALMAKLSLTDCLTAALRGELITDKNLYGVAEESLYEGTVMLGYTLAKHFEVRAEVRADMASAEVFKKGKTPRKNQATGLLGFLAYF